MTSHWRASSVGVSPRDWRRGDHSLRRRSRQPGS